MYHYFVYCYTSYGKFNSIVINCFIIFIIIIIYYYYYYVHYIINSLIVYPRRFWPRSGDSVRGGYCSGGKMSGGIVSAGIMPWIRPEHEGL